MPGEFNLTGPVWKLVSDSGDVGTEQDLQALAGATGVLTSNIPINQAVPEGDGIFFVEPRPFVIDEDGDISDPVTGEKGITLLADDPGLELTSPVQWRVSMNPITLGSRTIKPRPWWFNAPAPGDDKTLGELTPVPGVMHDGGTRGPRGYGITGDFKGKTTSEAEMLALTGAVGDWTAREDMGSIWVVTGSPTSSVDNWLELEYPTVSSIEAEDIIDGSASGLVVLTGTPAAGRTALQTDSYHLSVRYAPPSNGTDDRAAIQAVLDEGPGIVVFRKGGTWIVDPTGQSGGNMLKPQSNTWVIIQEGATVQVKDNALAGYALFCMDNVQNVTITGAGTLLGDSPTHTGSTGANGHLVLITNGSSNCRVIGPLLLKWAWGDGVYVGGTALCHDAVVDGLTIEDCRRQGVGLYWVDGCIVRNCRIFDIGLTDIDYTLCNAAAIDVEPNAAQVVNHVLIENNDVSACRGSGITVLGHFGTVTGVVVRGNRIDGCGYDSSVVIAGVPHGLIVKNVADSPQVIDNTVTNSGYSGGTAVSNLNVRLSNGAVVRGGFYAGASGPGIYVDTCTFATIDGATVDSNTHYGVLLNGSDDTLVNGCDLVDNCQDDAAGTAHLHIFNGDRTVARGNTLRGDLGVAWVITQDATVVDSLFVNNVGVGTAPTSMASDGGTNTVFVGNVRKGTGVYENWTTADKVAAGTVELGHASDTTVARTAAGRAAIEGAEIITSTAAVAADAKATPVDADRFVLFDSADSNEPKQSTWGNIKTTLASWLGLLPSGTAIAIHNQSDQTTNYERLRAFFSSNLAQLMTEQGGSGAFRDLRIGVGGAHYVNFSISNPKVLLSTGGGGVAGAMVQISTGTLTGASVAQTGLKIASTANQSGTSSYTTLEIDITETATGSGAKKPIRVKVGGSEKFYVDNAGGVLALGTVDVGHASDTTVSRLSAGQLGVEGNPLGTKVAVPSTASSTGVVGQWAVDASFVYYCTAANTWVRAAVATW